MKLVARCIGVPGDGWHHLLELPHQVALCGARSLNWIEDKGDAGPSVCEACVKAARQKLCLIRRM